MNRLTQWAVVALTLVAVSRSVAADDLLGEARAALERDDLAGAVRLLDRLIAQEPQRLDAYRLRGLANAELKRHREAVADFDQALRLDPKLAEAYNRRGFEQFKLGRMPEALADFDSFLELRPADRPHHWQRGLALYYAGRFKDGVEQFERHQTVNPNDVENAVWHYLCNVKVVGPDKARSALIRVGPDRRVPMMTVHRLFAGQARPEDVLRDAQAGDPAAERRRNQLFYAHLYLGLYYEAAGDAKQSLEHMTKTVEEFSQPHYMGDVARVHVKLRKPAP